MMRDPRRWTLYVEVRMARVMYVDDEAALRRVVRRWFEKRGMPILVAESVEEARHMLREHDVVGLFIDVWLGEETGFDLYAWIAEHRPQLKDRVVFITGDVAPGVAPGTDLQALGRAVIAKPFELHDLQAYVTRWTQGAREVQPMPVTGTSDRPG
jgi:DNA-binding NtrC family response regulator